VTGTALPFQRPLVVLIGPGSISGAESCAGPLRALGRATLVGERTAGACGALRPVELAPGWTIVLTGWHTVFGPQEWRLNRIGVPPDVAVSPSSADEAAGRDPQLEAALAVLRNPSPPS
jgi:C-terminal processing protease CtpA/Prc